MNQLLPVVAIAGAGYVLFQAFGAKTGHAKVIVQPFVRLEPSDDKEFTTRGMYLLKGVHATLLNNSGSFNTVNVLGQNHRITSDRLKELTEGGHLIVHSALKIEEGVSLSALAAAAKITNASRLQGSQRRPDVIKSQNRNQSGNMSYTSWLRRSM